MAAKTYYDHANSQWIGEREERDTNGDVHVRVEWFEELEDAARFTRTGIMPGQKTRRERTCEIRTTTELFSPLCGEPAVGKRWGATWACREHLGFGER